jgi:pyruvate dehydrogenase phosphatase
VKAALKEVARKREVRYCDLRTVDRGMMQHFHHNISVLALIDCK